MTREEAIKILEENKPTVIFEDEDVQKCMADIRNALDMAIKALEQEPCGDLISRQAVLDILEREGHKWGNDYRDWVDAIEEIKKLPSVKPQEPKTGHWILGICDNCGYDWGKDAPIASVPNYCPNCGRHMI